MRILMMADVPPDPNSGASGTEFQTAAALSRLGHDVENVWSDDLPHRVRHGNLHYLVELPRAYRDAMMAKMRDRHFDVVYANQPHGYLAARALAHKPGAPTFVHRSHGLESRVREALRPWQDGTVSGRSLARRSASSVIASLLERSNRAIARFADGHVVSSSLCAEHLVLRYGVRRDAVAVIAQAAPQVFHTTPVKTLDRRRLDRLLYVGQFAFVKGPQVLAAGFEEVLKLHPDASLTWVCDQKHHREAASLLSRNAIDRVTFRDWMPQQDLLDVYDDHGVFLFPSLFEGFGKAAIEAMARGLVLVTSAEGGAPDIVRHGSNGFLVPTGDPLALARACDQAMQSLKSAIAIGSAAREAALAFTWDRAARESVDFFRYLSEKK